MDTCDPNAEIADLRKLIKMNTGHSIKLTREQICQVYDDIQGGKLPLPPLVLDSKMSYLIDKKSPLTPKDFDVLFDSSSKRTDLKRIARKVGLVKTEQMTKNQIFDAIGKRLRYMNVHEPIKISRKRLLSSKSNTAANNAAVNNLGLNNAAANNAAANNLGLNNTGNSGNNLGLNNTGNSGNNLGLNNTGNNVNRNRNRNFNNNSAFNSGGGSNNLSNNASSKPNSKVSFPNKSLFATMNKPDFAKNQENMSQPKPMFTGMMGTKTPNFVNSNKKKTSFFGGLFGGSKNNNKNFIKANKFNKAKPGYVFKTGNRGLGYYKNEGPVVAQGPLKKPNGFGEPVAPVGPNNKKPNKPVNNKPNTKNTGVGNNKVNNNKNNNGNTIMTNANANANTNKPNKVSIGVGNNKVNNNKNNNGNTIMTNANNNTGPNSNVKPNNNANNANNQARRNEENRKKAEKEEQEAKKREEIEAKRKAARNEVVRRQEELKKKKEESKRIANIEKNLLSLPNVDKVYLTAFKGNKSVENVNKNALANKVKKDVVIRNLRNQLSPLFIGKRRVAYVNPANYNSTKANIERQITEKVAKKADLEALTKLSVNAAVSTNYVKAFANGKSFVNVSLNALKSKRNKDLEVYKLDATDKKGMFGGYSTTVPGTKTMKFIPNTEYNKSLNRAKNALQARRNAKQLAENKRKPKPANNTNTKSNNGNNTKSNNGNNVKPNNNTNKPNNGNNVKPNNNTNKPNTNTNKPNNGNNVKPNIKVNFMGPNNKLNTIEEEINKENAAIQNNTKPNKKPNNNTNNNFNASAELNKQLNNEAKRQNRAKNNNTNNNFNAAAELNKQLNNEAKRQNNNKKRANRAAKRNNANNNFNAAAELNKQLNNESTRQLENKRRQVRNKTEKHVAGFLGRIGMWNKQIKNANLNGLNALNKNLNKRIELKREINISKVPSKRELADKSKKYLVNVKNLRRIFEKELNNAENKKISNVTGPLVKGVINKVVAANSNKIEKKRALLRKKANDEIGGAFFIGGIGRWAAPIRNAKTENDINKLNTNLNERIKLKSEIRGNRNLNQREKDKIISNIMKFDVKISNLKQKYENARNKKISNTTGPLVKGILNKAVANNKRGSFNGGLRLGNNNNNIINGKPKPIYNNSNSNNNVNNKKKMRLGGRAAEQNMKPNPTFEPNMTNNPTFENNKPKITNENKKPLISAINSLKQLPKNKKNVFKGQLNSAFKNQNLNKMKAIRNEAIAANKVIQNQLAEEKRLKEEAKEAKRKEEAEKVAAKKAEREAKKKANALKAVENAANAYVAARKPKPPNAPKPNKPSFKSLVQKNKERRVMNAVKTAAQKTAISEATGAERVKLAKKFAPRTQANVKKANNAGKIFKTNVRKAAEGAADSAKEKLRRNAEKRATMTNKSSYQAKINSRNFKIPKNRKKIFTSRIQRATTLGQVLKAYENAQSELPK